jgi:hypothetical protein
MSFFISKKGKRGSRAPVLFAMEKFSDILRLCHFAKFAEFFYFLPASQSFQGAFFYL